MFFDKALHDAGRHGEVHMRVYVESIANGVTPPDETSQFLAHAFRQILNVIQADSSTAELRKALPDALAIPTKSQGRPRHTYESAIESKPVQRAIAVEVLSRSGVDVKEAVEEVSNATGMPFETVDKERDRHKGMVQRHFRILEWRASMRLAEAQRRQVAVELLQIVDSNWPGETFELPLMNRSDVVSITFPPAEKNHRCEVLERACPEWTVVDVLSACSSTAGACELLTSHAPIAGLDALAADIIEVCRSESAEL